MIPALAMLAYSMLVPLFYDSPIATDGILSVYVGNCPNNWWKLPLLIGNFDPSTEMVREWCSMGCRYEASTAAELAV